MRIAYDNMIFNLQKCGGISRYFNEVIQRIKKYNDVDMCIFKGLKGRLARLNDILIGCRLNANNCQIYHPTYYSSLIKKRKGIKTVITVCDMIHELYLSGQNGCERHLLVKKMSIMNADHIICISNNTKKDLKDIYGIEDEKISVIYLGTPLENIKVMNNREAKLKRPYILYVGKRMSYKNFGVLLKAFYKLSLADDFDLICFGGGGFTNDELSEFRKLNLKNSVKYAEGPDELLHSYYKNASVLVYPSIYEGFGLPVLEAMSFNCPVIASNSSSIPEVAGDAALLFHPEDVDELCSRIKNIVNDEKTRDYYIEKGKERVKDFSWDKTAMETLSVYKKLIG